MYKYKNIAVILCSFLILSLKSPYSLQAQDSDNFRFVVMGCMHLSVTDLNYYEAAIERIKEQKPDFVLFLGGMVEVAADKLVEILKQFDATTRKLGVPAYDVAGICRITKLSVPPDRKIALEKYFIARYKKRYYSFEYKNNLFICLDSDNLFNPKEGDFHDSQLEFLDKCVKDGNKYDNIFIALNKSYWFDNNDKRWLKVIQPIIEDKVKYVFGAGTHTSF
jgi:hypothetical protein